MAYIIWAILWDGKTHMDHMIWSINESYKDAISFKQNRAHNEMKQNLKKLERRGLKACLI